MGCFATALLATDDWSEISLAITALIAIGFPLLILMPPSLATLLGVFLLWLNLTISTAASRRVMSSKWARGPGAIVAGIPAISVWIVIWCGINLASSWAFFSATKVG